MQDPPGPDRSCHSGEDVYEIPEASIADVASEHDNDDDEDDSLTGYDINVPAAFDGHYAVRVVADYGLAMSASGYDANGIFATADVADDTAGPTGHVYDVLYSGLARSVTIAHVVALGVERATAVLGALGVRECPAVGPVQFSVATPGEDDAIDVFDIGGRRVAVLTAEGETVAWDWRRAGCRPGVYLARLRSQADKTVRFVIVR
jgi:hypothetical protein